MFSRRENDNADSTLAASIMTSFDGVENDFNNITVNSKKTVKFLL